MAKVHPSNPATTSSPEYTSSRKETFTIWMKSLLFHGNGCTVFNSNGEIIYRIDNYGEKSCDEVYLMDLRGKVLFTIKRKNLLVFQRWDGYQGNGDSKMMNREKLWFQVRKQSGKILERNTTCQVRVGCDRAKAGCFKIEGYLGAKSAFKIIDTQGRTVAEATQKQSSSGVVLGNDVFTLVVEPQIDHSFIMALVTVYGLINHQM